MKLKILRKLSFGWILILTIAGCKQDSSYSKIDIGFVDLDSILDEQVDLLKGNKLNKTVYLDGQKESKEISPDSTQWNNEISTFRLLDLNKATLTGSYEKSVDSNDLATKFLRKKGERNGPVYVIVEKDEDGRLLRVSGMDDQINSLFRSQKEFALVFDPNSGKLRSYEYSGYQKLIMKDTVRFAIEGVIL